LPLVLDEARPNEPPVADCTLARAIPGSIFLRKESIDLDGFPAIVVAQVLIWVSARGYSTRCRRFRPSRPGPAHSGLSQPRPERGAAHREEQIVAVGGERPRAA